MQELVAHQETINRQLARYGVKFGIYKNGEFKERLFPFDPLPRVIPAAEFAVLDKGLCQRVMALNIFLKDLYGDKKIIRDGVVPEDFALAGSGYLRGIYAAERRLQPYFRHRPGGRQGRQLVCAGG